MTQNILFTIYPHCHIHPRLLRPLLWPLQSQHRGSSGRAVSCRFVPFRAVAKRMGVVAGDEDDLQIPLPPLTTSSLESSIGMASWIDWMIRWSQAHIEEIPLETHI